MSRLSAIADRIPRAAVATVTGLVLLAAPACGQAGGEAGNAADSAAVARALDPRDEFSTDFSEISVPVGEIVSGGPPKDGIPAIDRPRFVSAGAAEEWLEPKDPVIVVEHGGETKAYPLRILMFHEIVNDRVGGRPMAVTYCPLCNTALVFDRRVDGRTLDFGTTGRLRHSDLVMYDRQTESWWQQASGEAIVGELTGTELEFVSANTLGWETARELYPDLRVLSRDTGFARRYGQNPYAGYDTRRGPIGAFFKADSDERLPSMERVATVDRGSGWAAPFSALRESRVAHDTVAGTPLVTFWAPGAASAVDAASVARGRDVGQTAVFDRRLDDRVLSFEWADGSFRDRETGSRWDLAGRAVSGPLEGRRLQPIPHGNHFWFAWAAFRPETEVWRP